MSGPHQVSGTGAFSSLACVAPKLVHQLSSGDQNPSRIGRVTTLTGLYKRRRFQDKEHRVERLELVLGHGGRLG